MRQLSRNGAAFIGGFEGFRSECYDDAAGNCTIGYGHLVHYGNTTDADRNHWGTISRAKAAQLLQADASHAAAAVRAKIHVPLRQPQFDALVSLVYNCGPGALDGEVGAAVNARPKYLLPLPTQRALLHWRIRVKKALVAWDHAGGRELAGLKRRRLAEFVLFDRGLYRRAGGNRYANA